MAFSGIAAVVSAIGAGTTAALSAATVLTAVAQVGMITTVVGAVTGNKKMMKVGGAMSLVGGVGAMVAGGLSAASGAAASAAGDAAAGAAADAAGQGIINSAGEQMTGSLVEQAAQAAATEGMGIAAAGSEAAIQQAAIDAASGNMARAATSQAANAAAETAMNQTAISATREGANMAAQAAVDPSLAMKVADPVKGAVTPTGPITPMGAANDISVTAVGEMGKTSAGGFFEGVSKVGQWMQKNPILAGAAVNIGGSMIQGMMTPDYQKEQLELQRRRLAIDEEAQRNRSNTVGVGSPNRTQQSIRGPIINGVRR